MRILIPVDGTPECEEPIPLAEELAEAVDGQIYLVRVVEVIDAFSPVRFDPDILRMMDEAARYLGELVSRFGLARDRTRYFVRRSDDAAKEIVSVVDREGIDLVIMASRCKGWLQRLAQGSVHHGVLRSDACPVLSVPLGSGAPVGAR